MAGSGCEALGLMRLRVPGRRWRGQGCAESVGGICSSCGVSHEHPLALRTCSVRQAMPPACAMLEAPLKMVDMMRVKSWATGWPHEKRSASGTTVQPSRTPVKPAYLEKEHVSMAT